MKSLQSCLIMSDGSLIVVSRPRFKGLLDHTRVRQDIFNHPFWSGNNTFTNETEIAGFIEQFKVDGVNSSLKYEKTI
uniref:Ribosomal protein L31 n=1 Tax=Dictyopteris divaricata TaxID=156996 RepID=A0A4Y5T7L6_9PHAE|nr:ribosomal protein L31 [Dictyopteris divaricata]QDB64138.1 ribosomal protein L31 [Dictyopteris divaricata]